LFGAELLLELTPLLSAASLLESLPWLVPVLLSPVMCLLIRLSLEILLALLGMFADAVLVSPMRLLSATIAIYKELIFYENL
jgi:hypothetical protein